jgi:succinyl-CoA synthetase beta subunit
LGIEIARELDHPPTDLERIAYAVERDDHRGTFYFAQLATGFSLGEGYIGFHGAGGGGSMMSMDAATRAGFKLANFTDTSGNPSAAKVYRAARIILSQPNLVHLHGCFCGLLLKGATGGLSASVARAGKPPVASERANPQNKL